VAPLRVALRATDPVMLAGLTSFLESEVALVERHELTEHDVMVVQVERLTPQVIAELRRGDILGRVPKVLLTDEFTRSDVQAVAACRVAAVLSVARISRAQLVKTVLSVAGRHNPMSPHVLDRLLEAASPFQDDAFHPKRRQSDGLTVREVDVLRLVAEGYDTAQIAVKLCYSQRTVKNIVYALTTRLKLRNRPHAVAYAIRNGVI
jgi:DNA-binding NarL/FixJ family response regulator